jgi:phosphatidate cytidylyltransferase
VLALIAGMCLFVIRYPAYDAPQLMMAFFGLVYVAVMISYMFQIRMQENGAFLVWLVFISSWGCDTCAYCAGMLFGKHKMAPVLSPKKSVEGAVGGVVSAAVFSMIYAAVVGRFMLSGSSRIAVFALIGAVGALISMVGDLAASAIKRNHDIKDYGKLIPGHGGILDRFDSVIITAPVIYLLAYAFR